MYLLVAHAFYGSFVTSIGFRGIFRPYHRQPNAPCQTRDNMVILFFDYQNTHDDVIKWKHFPRNWPFVRGIHRSPVNSPHKGQWRGALMFTLICVWINGCVNNRKAGDLRRYCAHYGITVMWCRENIADSIQTIFLPKFPVDNESSLVH